MSNPLKHPAYLHLLKSFQRSKTHLTISYLNLNSLSKNPEIFTAFLLKYTKKLQTTKNLKSLTLDLQGVQIDQESIKELFKYLLKTLRDLENFKITLCPISSYQTQYFQILFKSLRLFHSLKRFELVVPNQSARFPLRSPLPNLIKILQKSAPRLQDMKLIFNEGAFTNLLGTDFYKLDKWGLKRLGNLQSLTLTLSAIFFLHPVNDFQDGILDLSNLRRMNKLKSLDITLLEVLNDYRGSISSELTFDPKKFFPNLRSWKCGVIYSRPTSSKGLEQCGSEIASRLLSLQDFGLRFKQTLRLAEEEVERTTQCLSSLNTDLTHLSMSFTSGELNKASANAFIAALSNPRLRKIKTFSLEFLKFQGINNGFVSKIGAAFEKNMNEIRALRLRFDSHEPFSSTFVQSFMAIVGKEGITDRAIRNLGASLSKRCQKLEIISLEFKTYTQISDKGVESLCKGLSKIGSLRSVWLKFRFCPAVSETGGNRAKKKLGEKVKVKFSLI